ncbi:MAG: hypothetical protein Q7R56_03395 [Nanoarchaeota archaeon]|nr:hypothetical protein [Nanoarchaeota archaeon]
MGCCKDNKKAGDQGVCKGTCGWLGTCSCGGKPELTEITTETSE